MGVICLLRRLKPVYLTHFLAWSETRLWRFHQDLAVYARWNHVWRTGTEFQSSRFPGLIVFDHFFVDCAGPLFSSEGSKPKFNYAFVAVDSFSRFLFCSIEEFNSQECVWCIVITVAIYGMLFLYLVRSWDELYQPVDERIWETDGLFPTLQLPLLSIFDRFSGESGGKR